MSDTEEQVRQIVVDHLGIDESKVFLARQSKELNIEQLNKLYSSGITDVLALTNLESENLSKILGISIDKSKKLLNH